MKRKIAKSIVLVQIVAVLCGIFMFCFGCGEPNPYAVYKAGEHGLISLGPNSEGVKEITFRSVYVKTHRMPRMLFRILSFSTGLKKRSLNRSSIFGHG